MEWRRIGEKQSNGNGWSQDKRNAGATESMDVECEAEYNHSYRYSSKAKKEKTKEKKKSKPAVLSKVNVELIENENTEESQVHKNITYVMRALSSRLERQLPLVGQFWCVVCRDLKPIESIRNPEKSYNHQRVFIR